MLTATCTEGSTATTNPISKKGCHCSCFLSSYVIMCYNVERQVVCYIGGAGSAGSSVY